MNKSMSKSGDTSRKEHEQRRRTIKSISKSMGTKRETNGKEEMTVKQI